MDNLKTELLELSNKVDEFLIINTVGNITTKIELATDIELPLQFECEALHPGTFKGVTIDEQEIIKAKDTIFQSEGNFHNYEINKQHRSARKETSTVDDLLGKVIAASYDYSVSAYKIKGEVWDMSTALKIVNGLVKYVSLAIKPNFIEEFNGQRFARNLEFQELSFVRAPGDASAHITNFKS